MHEAKPPMFDFLSHGGEMGALMRAADWAASPLGPTEGWPPLLKSMLRVMLSSSHPMFLWWGPELIQFYNDAYSRTMGPERHPCALGARGRECWAEIWPIIGPQIEFVMDGKGATWHEDQLVAVTRHGKREDVWWTYGHSPVEDDAGVHGVLVVCNDVTAQHRARAELERVNQALGEQVRQREQAQQLEAQQAAQLLKAEQFLHQQHEAEAERLRALFQQAPGFMCILRGPDMVYEFANAAYSRFIGERELIGKTVRAAIPEAEGQGFFEALERVYQTAIRATFMPSRRRSSLRSSACLASTRSVASKPSTRMPLTSPLVNIGWYTESQYTWVTGASGVLRNSSVTSAAASGVAVW